MSQQRKKGCGFEKVEYMGEVEENGKGEMMQLYHNFKN